MQFEFASLDDLAGAVTHLAKAIVDGLMLLGGFAFLAWGAVRMLVDLMRSHPALESMRINPDGSKPAEQPSVGDKSRDLGEPWSVDWTQWHNIDQSDAGWFAKIATRLT